MDLEREVRQLPVHLTSFPSVAVTVLFILCFFLCAFFSHVDSYKRLRCTARTETIHHEYFKRLALQFTLNRHSLSHLSWFPCVWGAVQSSLPHTGTHHRHRDCLSSLHRIHSCFFFFNAPLAGKSIFVQTILATSPVYSVLKTEPLYEEQPGSPVVQSCRY